MSASLRRETKARAAGRCEYCGLAQHDSLLPFHVEHVIPRQHGGVTASENLALACPSCNLHKGPNLTGIDPDSGAVCRLFHPRRDLWSEHFLYQESQVIGISPIGRTTVWVLVMNSEEQLSLRESS